MEAVTLDSFMQSKKEESQECPADHTIRSGVFYDIIEAEGIKSLRRCPIRNEVGGR
jgi:hypothetical protein